MTIYIENLKFLTIIGILDFERETEQEIIVNLTIEYDYKKEFINYAEVSQLVKNHIQISRFLLIEDALSSLTLLLKEKFSLIQRLDLKITKPSIMPDCVVSVSNKQQF